jgi:hypothetical protein
MSALVLASVAVFETIGPPIAAMALRLSGDAGRGAKVLDRDERGAAAEVESTVSAPMTVTDAPETR